MAILDIRGTQGSGKSWIMHSLLASHSHVEIEDNGQILGYHIPEFDAAIVGKYQTVCGGCDVVPTADEVCRRVRMFAKQYRHVLLEGILVAHTFKRYRDLSFELEEFDYRFLFLNTPIKTCIRRVKRRRLGVGNSRPFNKHHLVYDYGRIWQRLRPKFEAAGCSTTVLNYKDPLPQVLEILSIAD